MWNFAIPGLLFLGSLTIAALWLFRKMSFRQRAVEFDVEWLEEFSASRYRPMERLFQGEDYEFLAAQRGYRPELEKKLRAERRKVFRGYLVAMRNDFEKLMAAGKLLYLANPEPDPQFATMLYRHHTTFMKRYYYAYMLLTLQDLGLARADASGLISLLDSIGGQVRGVMTLPTVPDAA